MSKAAFLRKRVERVQVGDETFHVRPLTGAQFETLLANEGDERLDGVRALSLVACFCACDETGARIFADEELQQLREEGDFAVIKAVAEAALKASGLEADEGNG